MVIEKQLLLNSAKRLEEFIDFASDNMNEVYIVGNINHTDNGDYHMNIKYDVSEASKMELLLDKWHKEDNPVDIENKPFFPFPKKFKF